MWAGKKISKGLYKQSKEAIIGSMKTIGYRSSANQLFMAGDGLSVTTTGLLWAFISPGHFSETR